MAKTGVARGSIRGPRGPGVAVQPFIPTSPEASQGWLDSDDVIATGTTSTGFNNNPNPGPAVDLTGWSGNSLTHVTDARAPRGKFARALFTGNWSTSVNSPVEAATPGDQDSAVATVKADRAQSVRLGFGLFKNGTYVNIAGATNVALAADTPTTINITATLPAGDYNEVRVILDGPNAVNGDLLYMAAVRTTPGLDNTIVYRDGDSAGWYWKGTAGNSKSEQGTESLLRPLYLYDGAAGKWYKVADDRVAPLMARTTEVETEQAKFWRKSATLLRYSAMPEEPIPYPISAYGLVTASLHPDDIANTTGGAITINTMELVRLWVPPEKVITGAVAPLVSAGATAGTSGASGFRLYSDDGQTVLGTTANDYALFTTAGWRAKAFAAAIPASDTGYWARLGVIHTCSTAPKWYLGNNIGAALLSGHRAGSSHRRVAYASAGSPPAWPSTITPASWGTLDPYNYFMGLY